MTSTPDLGVAAARPWQGRPNVRGRCRPSWRPAITEVRVEVMAFQSQICFVAASSDVPEAVNRPRRGSGMR